MGHKGVNIAARPPEGNLAEVGGLWASNLPLVSIPHPARMPDYVNVWIQNYVNTNVTIYVSLSMISFYLNLNY